VSGKRGRDGKNVSRNAMTGHSTIKAIAMPTASAAGGDVPE